MRKLIAALTVASAVLSVGVITTAAPAGAAVSCTYTQDTMLDFIGTVNVLYNADLASGPGYDTSEEGRLRRITAVHLPERVLHRSRSRVPSTGPRLGRGRGS
jgi:hypothetical protein